MSENASVIDNVLSIDLCHELVDKYKQTPHCNRTNKTIWSENIIHHSNYVLVNDLNNHERNKVLQHVFKVLPEYSDDNIHAMFYRWTKFSYIPPHDDRHVDYAITIHLNVNYTASQGGVFMYKEQDDIHWTGVEPIFNRLVCNKNNIVHWVTPVTSNEDRYSLQIFPIK